jgi:aspartate/methionine/tyrosine aminotransferase
VAENSRRSITIFDILRVSDTIYRAHGTDRVEEFSRLKRLPAYVFNITSELKSAARHRGEDIIDFGMGNPDGATPQHIVDKMIEAARKPETHRYSLSRGIPRLRRAICNWYQRRYDVMLDPDIEAIATIGSKEGIAHLCLATLDQGDVVVRIFTASRFTTRRHFLPNWSGRYRSCTRVRRCSSSTFLRIRLRSVPI